MTPNLKRQRTKQPIISCFPTVYKRLSCESLKISLHRSNSNAAAQFIYPHTPDGMIHIFLDFCFFTNSSGKEPIKRHLEREDRCKKTLQGDWTYLSHLDRSVFFFQNSEASR